MAKAFLLGFILGAKTPNEGDNSVVVAKYNHFPSPIGCFGFGAFAKLMMIVRLPVSPVSEWFH